MSDTPNGWSELDARAGDGAQYLQLLPDLDNAALTYYPLNTDFTVRPPSSVAEDLQQMVSVIPGKPMAGLEHRRRSRAVRPLASCTVRMSVAITIS